jgi:outer membrane protein W
MLRSFLIALTCVCALPVQAADPDGLGYLHLGASIGRQQDDASISMLGAPIADAGFQTQLGFSGSVEAGLFLRSGFALAASAMWPTTTSNVGTGSIAALGNLGDETYGYYSLTAQYHLPVAPRFIDGLSFYVGAGLGYMHVSKLVDGAVTDMKIADALGPVLQAGVDYRLAGNIGVFADVKRYFLSTAASGQLGGVAISADVRVDPWVVSTGIGIDF